MKHDPEVKIFYSDGYFIFHKNFLTTRVPVNFLEETRFSTSIYHLDTPLWRYNTRKYSLGELILLAKSKEYTLFYIPDKFQGVWMTKIFRRSVFDRSLNSTHCLLSHFTLDWSGNLRHNLMWNMAVNNNSYPIYPISTRTEKGYITKMIPFFFCSVYLQYIYLYENK